MAERDDSERAQDDAATQRDVDAAIEDKFAGDGDEERTAREGAARDRWDAAEERRAAARDRDRDLDLGERDE